MTGLQLDGRIKLLFLAFFGLVLALSIGLSIGSSDYRPVVFGVLIIGLLAVWFGTGEMFWIITIGSSFLSGTFPILGGSFNTFQILMAIGVAKFIVEEVIFRRRRLARINPLDFKLLAGFMAILVFHGIKDRFGMRFLGSDVWGGRNYINVFVGLAAFFIIQSVPLKSRTWAKLPYVILGFTAFDLIIAVITTVFPSSIYKIFPFYSAVSVTGVSEILTGESSETARVVSSGNFGCFIITLVLASISLPRLFLPPKLGRLVWLGLGWIAVLVSSFRSNVFNAAAAMVLAGIRDLRWAVLAFLPLLALFLFGLSFVNSEIVPLPKPVQRSLSFLPGKWDVEMELNAMASNDFREQVWTIWKREYFPLHPWLGRGFGFRSAAVESPVAQSDPYWNKMNVEVGNVHNGFFAALDAFGIIGAVFFIIWNLRLLLRTLRVGFRRDDPAGMSLRFIALFLGVVITSYWGGAQNVGSFLPQEFALAGAFLALQKLNTSSRIDPAQASERSQVLVA